MENLQCEKTSSKYKFVQYKCLGFSKPHLHVAEKFHTEVGACCGFAKPQNANYVAEMQFAQWISSFVMHKVKYVENLVMISACNMYCRFLRFGVEYSHNPQRKLSTMSGPGLRVLTYLTQCGRFTKIVQFLV